MITKHTSWSHCEFHTEELSCIYSILFLLTQTLVACWLTILYDDVTPKYLAEKYCILGSLSPHYSFEHELGRLSTETFQILVTNFF